MEDKEIGNSYSREDFEKRLRALERHVKASQLRSNICDLVKDDRELYYLLKCCAYWIENDVRSEFDTLKAFFKDTLLHTFTKILTDEQTRGWFTEIHSAIQRRNIELVHLLVLTLQNDLFNFDLVQILAHLWNPNSYFFVKNKFGDSSPPSYKASMQGNNEDEDETPEKNHVFTQKSKIFVWLIDLLERFGKLGGFPYLTKYFSTINSIDQVAVFLRCSSNIINLLSVRCEEYFIPMKDKLQESLASMSDKEVKALDTRGEFVSPITAITSFQKILRQS